MRQISRACVLALALGLLGCPTVDLGDSPVAPGSCRPSRAYFETMIWPEYIAPADTSRSCVDEAGCHRQSDGRSSYRLATDPVDMSANYEATTRFLNCGSPTASSLLTKPLTGTDSHGGDDLFNMSSPSYTVFLDWFSAL